MRGRAGRGGDAVQEFPTGGGACYSGTTENAEVVTDVIAVEDTGEGTEGTAFATGLDLAFQAVPPPGQTGGRRGRKRRPEKPLHVSGPLARL